VVAPALPLEPGQLDYMTARVGRYPFDIFGSLIVDADLGFALETQTISLLDRVWFSEYSQDVWDPTMLHELSHMWFGDSVSPYSWSDLWLNEGHASWYHGGALVLYALRQKIGSAKFARLEREWVSPYRDDVASTEDFIALASHVAHRDLRPFLRDWLYGPKTPPMPGHPDWTVDPVQPQAQALRSARSPRGRSIP
jgi:aminopeptidase N